MENKQSSSKKNFISVQEEKFKRAVDYSAGSPCRQTKKPLPIGLEIFQKTGANQQDSQRVLVSIQQRVQPPIKIIYKSCYSKKGSSKCGSNLAIGDHASFITQLSENDSNIVKTVGCITDQENKTDSSNISSIILQFESFSSTSQNSCAESPRRENVYNDMRRPPERCYMYIQPNMNLPKHEVKVNASTISPNKVDIATLIVTKSSSEDSASPVFNVNKLYKNIDNLEHKILRQEMVFRSLNPTAMSYSSDEGEKDNGRENSSGPARPGCSYVDQYSHVPDRSAFHRFAHQVAPLSPSKTTTIEKEHNSEQYGRDFTTYDGITARGRRQCASVPCKRDDIPKLAAERVQKIRHKLNPVRDYRLMDTVHYLAQGEFAPRDDGIKLTLSREAVLSDIIYEDVCRTHWPNNRLGRRGGHTERSGTRCELQRLIDSLLRERVAHVERRRRRHYRIVKLNHRNESVRPLGKTGDIIVASHKNRSSEETAAGSDHNRLIIADRKREDQNSRRSHRSHDRIQMPESRHKRRSRQDECSPGPSYANGSPSSRKPTSCYHHTSTKIEAKPKNSKHQEQQNHDIDSGSSASGYKGKAPRLLVKKDSNCHKQTKDEPNLEHYILLPTLVVRTPSNMKRQKKFNELYHKILNVQLNNTLNGVSEAAEAKRIQKSEKKDIGLNINITLSNSTEELNIE